MNFLRLFSPRVESERLREDYAPREQAQAVADYLCTAIMDRNGKRFHEHEARAAIAVLDRI